MPRVEIKKKEYKLRDLKGWIVMQMKLNGIRQQDIADALGVSQGVISLRLKTKKENNKDPFSYGDILTLCELFNASDEEKQRLLTL